MNYLKLIKIYIICFLFIFQYLLYILFHKEIHENLKFDKNKKYLTSSSLNYNEFLITNFTDKNEKENILSRGRMFLDKCLNSTNINIYKTNDHPDITVIIPSYNCEKTITASIHSVQYQNFSNIEIIIVDDFSTDKSEITINNLGLF